MFENTKGFLNNFLEPFVDLFAWGILERHPKLKMVMAEAGTGWLPWLVQELDYRHWRLWEAKEFWADKGGAALETKPSELFKRQLWATFQEDYAAMSLIPFFGEGHLLWASDYPHPDSVWPHSREAIERQMSGLTPEMRRKLTHDNAARLYRPRVRKEPPHPSLSPTGGEGWKGRRGATEPYPKLGEGVHSAAEKGQ